MKKRSIIVGDIHGCYNEFFQLLSELDFSWLDDEVITAGDLVEKGPYSDLVVDWFELMSRSPAKSGFAVSGNHDESMVRFWNHEMKVARGAQSKNPMKAHEDRVKTFKQLSSYSYLLEYLSSLPMYIEREIAGTKYLILHGGLFPGVSPEKMDPKIICRLRYLKKNDHRKMVQAGREEEGDPFWAEVYDGKYGFVFYGHQPSDGKIQHWDHACGLDTGAVYGNKLSACIIDHKTGARTFHQVQAEKKYAEAWRSDD